MVSSKLDGARSLFAKLARAIISEDTTEDIEETEPTVKPEPLQAKPMKAYWETDKQSHEKRNQPFIDSFLNHDALIRIPDTTEEAVKESHYKYAKFHLFNLPDDLQNRNQYQIGVTDPPKPGTGISNSGRDAGAVAGIVVAVISGVLILAGLIAVVLYKHYVHRNVTSMNFDNPVYRKTTEDQFALEKNGYAPGSKLYPSTVGEEAREPLNTPGTNEYV